MRFCHITGALAVAFVLSTIPAHATTVSVNVPIQDILAPVGAFLPTGQAFSISASGSANLAYGDGNYVVDPNGTILTLPTLFTPAYDSFSQRDCTFSVGGSCTVGNAEANYWQQTGSVALAGDKFGVLLAAFSNSNSATQYADISNFIVVGASGDFVSPGGYLYLAINDLNPDGGDKSGGYSVDVSAVPLPPALPLFGAAILGIGAYARRRNSKAA